MANLLIIEDSPLIVQMLTMVCEGTGHSVVSTETFASVPAHLADSPPDLIITDLNLPDAPGANALQSLKDLDLGDIPIIIISGRPLAELEEIAKTSGAQGALSKDDGMAVISARLPEMIGKLVG